MVSPGMARSGVESQAGLGTEWDVTDVQGKHIVHSTHGIKGERIFCSTCNSVQLSCIICWCICKGLPEVVVGLHEVTTQI